MSQSLIVTGANFYSAGLGRLLQLTTDRTNLVGEFILGRDNNTSTYNSAYTGAPPSTEIGTITYGDHFADPAGVNFFRTSILNNANITMLSIVAPGAAAGTEIYIASSTGADPNGFYLGNSSGPATLSVINSSGTQTQLPLDNNLASPLTDFRGISARIGGTTTFTMEIDEFKNGARVQSKAVTGTGSRAVDSQFFCIGSLNGSTIWNSAKNTSAILIWHRLLTDTEILNSYLECRNTLSKMNIAC